MRLEDEIKQNKPFQDQYQKLAVNLLFSGSWIRNINSAFFGSFNISSQQYNILRILRGQHPKPASVNLLIGRMVDKMSNASRLVEKLRQKGFVARTESEFDRRRADVIITESGLSLLEQIEKIMPDEYENNFKTLSENEAKTLNGLLDKMRG